jgi:hypothetical protein
MLILRELQSVSCMDLKDPSSRQPQGFPPHFRSLLSQCNTREAIGREGERERRRWN